MGTMTTMKTMMPSFRYNASAMRSTFERRIMRTHVAAATAMPSKHQEQLSRQQPRDAILPATSSSPPSPSNRLLDSSQNTSPQLLHLGKYEATLLMDCPSQQGVVAACASMLYAQGCNILETDQYSCPYKGLFFQRIRFDYSDCYLGNTEVAIAGLEAAIESVASRFHMKWSMRCGDKPKRMAILVSKFDHCLYDILLRKNSNELKCEIPLIISNHETLSHIGEQFEIPFYHLPMVKDPNATPDQKIEAKLRQENEIENLLEEYDIDTVVLARYMQVLSDDFCKRHETHTINIHHSFLPAFEGGYPYHRAYDRGVKIIGATAHYITADLDAGPIIDQDVIRISHRDSVEDMIQKGRNLERSVLSRALSWHLQDKVLIHNNKTVVFGY